VKKMERLFGINQKKHICKDIAGIYHDMSQELVHMEPQTVTELFAPIMAVPGAFQTKEYEGKSQSYKKLVNSKILYFTRKTTLEKALREAKELQLEFKSE
jgi:hypothetical protein